MQTERFCAICSVSLGDANKTKEHVIPHSIGGRRKVAGFICIDCNSRAGNNWDAELALQFNWFSVTLGIVRENGEPPPMMVATISGNQLLLNADGSMVPARFNYREVEEYGRTKIGFTARTFKEARKKIDEIGRRFPKLDKAKAMESAEMQTTYLTEPLKVDLNFGGPRAGRSVVKTALAFAFANGIDSASCENATIFLRDECAPPTCYGLFYLRDIVKDRDLNKIFHCVGIHADSTNRVLMAYVEYFGLARWLVVLSKTYEGVDISGCYALDPTTGEQISIELDWPVDQSMVDLVVEGHGYTNETYGQAVSVCMEEVMRRSDKRSWNSAIRNSLAAAAETLGLKEGDPIPVDIVPKFMEAIQPFLMHKMGIRRPNIESED